MEELPGSASELSFQGLVAEFGRDSVAVLGGRGEAWSVGKGDGAMKCFLEGDVLLAAHVACVEDEPEEDDDDGDEHEARRRTSRHLV